MKNDLESIFGWNLMEESSVMTALLDLKLNITWANKAYRQFTGITLKEIKGRRCYECWGRSTPCPDCPGQISLISGKDAQARLILENRKEGSHDQRSLLSKVTPVRDADNKVIGIMEAMIDVTELITQRRRQERISEAFLRLLEYATGHTTKELLREFLDEAESLTGSGIGFYHFVEDDQKTLSLQRWSTNTMKQCSAPGEGTHYSIQKAGVWVDCVREGKPVIHNDYASLPHKKGLPEGHAPVIRELVVPVIRGGKLVAILGVGNKETDYDEYDVKVVGQLAELLWETVLRKRAEEENERLQAQYYQSQKNEMVGRLAGGVAHDFNNMLSVILGQVELALEKLDRTQPLYYDLIDVRRAAERSANLTRQLLAFSRQQTIAPRPINLNEIIGDMLKMLKRLIGENIDLTWKPHGNLGQVKMDPVQIDQILANLCINARDAISGTGKVTIETYNASFDDDYCLDHPDFHPGNFIALVVSDNGCGMDKEILLHIFEPFFTTKEIGKGTGLGLATVYGIVKQNQGFINVYSEPDQGTTFKIYLSRHEAEGRTSRIKASKTSIHGGDETILLVEDERMILDLCRRMLESCGYHVLAANTPVNALEMARQFSGAIDLLITDVVMPEMNGRLLAERLTEIHPQIRTLFMSGYTANVIANHGILQDHIDFIQKPFSKNALISKVREVLSQEERQLLGEELAT